MLASGLFAWAAASGSCGCEFTPDADWARAILQNNNEKKINMKMDIRLQIMFVSSNTTGNEILAGYGAGTSPAA
jgi:hypothetical protein